jgi:hypothetical protein
VSRAAPVLLVVGVVTLAAAHVAIVVALARTGAWFRAALTLVLPPLAPWWAWERGFRRGAMAWAAGIVVYALGVVVA